MSINVKQFKEIIDKLERLMSVGPDKSLNDFKTLVDIVTYKGDSIPSSQKNAVLIDIGSGILKSILSFFPGANFPKIANEGAGLIAKSAIIYDKINNNETPTDKEWREWASSFTGFAGEVLMNGGLPGKMFGFALKAVSVSIATGAILGDASPATQQKIYDDLMPYRGYDAHIETKSDDNYIITGNDVNGFHALVGKINSTTDPAPVYYVDVFNGNMSVYSNLAQSEIPEIMRTVTVPDGVNKVSIFGGTSENENPVLVADTTDNSLKIDVTYFSPKDITAIENALPYVNITGFDLIHGSAGMGNLYKDPGGSDWKSGNEDWTYDPITHTYTSKNGYTLVINNFDASKLGIHMIQTPANAVSFNEIKGDLKPVDFNPDLEGIQIQIDQWGNVIVDSGTTDPNRNDTFYDTTGNDKIEGLGGDDVITMRQGGSDWLLGGEGRDSITVTAASGNAIIEGNAGADLLSGGAGDDRIFGDNYGVRADLITAGETVPASISCLAVRGTIRISWIMSTIS